MLKERLINAKHALEATVENSDPNLFFQKNNADKLPSIDQLWNIQSKIEYAILMIKLYLREDQMYSSSHTRITGRQYREIIDEASQLFQRSLQSLSNDELSKALKDARDGRNLIRDLIGKLRRINL